MVHPTLTRLGKFFHHDRMYARKWPLPLCVLCGFNSQQGPSLCSLSASTPCCTVFNSTTSMSTYATVDAFLTSLYLRTDKKENQIFLIYKEIQSGAVAKSYMWKGFLIYEEMRKYFPYARRPLAIYDSVLNFLIYEENLIFFFVSAGCAIRLVCSSYSSINCS